MHGAIAEVLYLEGAHLGGLTGSRLGALYVFNNSACFKVGRDVNTTATHHLSSTIHHPPTTHSHLPTHPYPTKCDTGRYAKTAQNKECMECISGFFTGQEIAADDCLEVGLIRPRGGVRPIIHPLVHPPPATRRPPVTARRSPPTAHRPPPTANPFNPVRRRPLLREHGGQLL